MSVKEPSREPAKPAHTPKGGSQDESQEKAPSHDKDARQTGRFGSDEPDYGRPHGEKPNPGKGGRANPQGAEYEQGGSYPGPSDNNGAQTGKTGSSEPHGNRERG